MLNYHQVPETPSVAFYIPNFISKEKEEFLLKKVYEAPKPKWTSLLNRRLQSWGGSPHPRGMVQEKLPHWLEDCCRLVSETRAFDKINPQHVLVNEYKPGQGILPHKDGPLYFPTVTTISLGGHTVLDFYKASHEHMENLHRYEFSLFLEPCSLLVVKNLLYTDYLHGISDTVTDNFKHKVVKNMSMIGDETLRTNMKQNTNFILKRHCTRISLTIRNVPKTVKFKFKT